ncbi:MAG TPA: 1-phosphofructokinase family hexose kinase [Solirubrobacterales bacterium]|nr:1-phosphofructokinase family hexose kinase [Solirubrobacterales bacterium]
MILTVTLNAAMDRTVAVPNFRLGRRHRSVEQRSVAGGKGLNVARALRLLGEPVIATGFAGGPTGERITQELTGEGVLNDFTRIGDESRTNLAVIDPTSGEQTEINERGPTVSAEEVEQFAEKLLYLAQGADFCVIAGSVPPGVDLEIYGWLITELRRLELPVLLDSDGEPMRAGLRAGPAVVAPNVAEAEEAVGHEFNEPDDLVLGLRELIEMGAGEAIITREAGCVAIVGEPAARTRYEVEIEPLEPIAAVGSGDAFLAGYAAARYRGSSPRDCLAFGVACGAESTQHFGAGTIDAREVERLLPRVDVRELDVPAGVA